MQFKLASLTPMSVLCRISAEGMLPRPAMEPQAFRLKMGKSSDQDKQDKGILSMALEAQNSLNSVFTGEFGPMWMGFILHTSEARTSMIPVKQTLMS